MADPERRGPELADLGLADRELAILAGPESGWREWSGMETSKMTLGRRRRLAGAHPGRGPNWINLDGFEPIGKGVAGENFPGKKPVFNQDTSAIPTIQ
jgi:hypothetical protein